MPWYAASRCAASRYVCTGGRGAPARGSWCHTCRCQAGPTIRPGRKQQHEEQRAKQLAATSRERRHDNFSKRRCGLAGLQVGSGPLLAQHTQMVDATGLSATASCRSPIAVALLLLPWSMLRNNAGKPTWHPCPPTEDVRAALADAWLVVTLTRLRTAQYPHDAYLGLCCNVCGRPHQRKLHRAATSSRQAGVTNSPAPTQGAPI